MQPLPRTAYGGNVSGYVDYLVDGHDVYFTGILANATTTVNAAEDIVVTLSKIVGVPWDDLTFYDVQTVNGGYDTVPGRYKIDRLDIYRNTGMPVVRNWIPVAASADLSGQHGLPHDLSELQGIPDVVLRRFRRYIDAEI